MAERPILFSAPMVRAILAGRKTRTRRLLAAPSRSVCTSGRWVDLDFGSDRVYVDGLPASGQYLHVPVFPDGDGCVHRVWSRVEPGDRLWVKEAWAYFGGDELLYQQHRPSVAYRASYEPSPVEPGYVPGGRWRASIHMPRWASRLTLRVTEVRAERLQAITSAEIWAEGIAFLPLFSEGHGSPLQYWIRGWDAINPGAPWSSNPWVWAYAFEVLP